LVKDLVLAVPAQWTVDEPRTSGARVLVNMRFDLIVDDGDTHVRMHKAPRFGGAILVECEPMADTLDAFMAARMSSFASKVRDVRVTSQVVSAVAGQRSIVREHAFIGPGAALLHQRLAVTVYEGSAYIIGTANTAGAGFAAAARVFDACVDHAAWRASEDGGRRVNDPQAP
jgi:hypothetical protein